MASEHIEKCGNSLNIKFVQNPQVPQGSRHPLNFAREVVARLLGMPERADWKDCALSIEDEKRMAENFKKLFEPYDWSLKEET
ncbi:hypothetical protein GUITHDRAFT_108214 [Guillardia theta CCMP2712]|uniref:Cwf19-like protein C-terminal domain-containing protein n=1 Tax=Guillardia theta (strain CCMP2712) TaxID=905079 RepID=L1JBT0_GUITC|nr:hypothetical protein GUITHDRAFT_108214 [Guillardia theta CCMP2712]EKX45757.1 hypothetical protein GUITHDRAFT_108214 [Guillardia theta CCMP2712]|eukprot:XP_005832737.1 hypothetical protein GUITHDRAFT_108214 [Guillardia theta CCMP2712]